MEELNLTSFDDILHTPVGLLRSWLDKRDKKYSRKLKLVLQPQSCVGMY